MTDYSKMSRSEARRAADRSWRDARIVQDVLNLKTSTEARGWLKHFRQAGVPMRRLFEGEVKAVEHARRVMHEIGGKPIPNPPPPSALERSAAKCRRAMSKPEGEAITTLNRTQIALWMIGKCGTAKLALDGFRRALVALGEEHLLAPDTTSRLNRYIHLYGYGSSLACEGKTLEFFTEIADDYTEDELTLILEGFNDMGGNDAQTPE